MIVLRTPGILGFRFPVSGVKLSIVTNLEYEKWNGYILSLMNVG